VTLVKFFWIFKVNLKKTTFLVKKLSPILMFFFSHPHEITNGQRLTNCPAIQSYNLFASRHCKNFDLHLDCISEPYICCLPWNIVLVSLRHRRDCLFQSPTTYLGHLRTRVEHQFFSNKRPKPIQVQ